MTLLQTTPDPSLQVTAEQEVFRCERAMNAAEASLTAACFGANHAAVKHYRQVLDRTVEAYESAVRTARRAQQHSNDDEPGSFS
jgi:hypothetical protein